MTTQLPVGIYLLSPKNKRSDEEDAPNGELGDKRGGNVDRCNRIFQVVWRLLDGNLLYKLIWNRAQRDGARDSLTEEVTIPDLESHGPGCEFSVVGSSDKTTHYRNSPTG